MLRTNRNLLLSVCFASMVTLIGCQSQAQSSSAQTGNVIFIHPDGTGANTYAATRILTVGPDNDLNWDRMDKVGIYRVHQLNGMGTSSNAGATAHAFGMKSEIDDYGIDPDRPLPSLSGKPYSIMVEAQKAGIAVGLINSGHINEPGSGVFLASAKTRQMNDLISEQIIHSGAELLFSGGEARLLPPEVTGFHGEAGTRKDGRNLIEEAQALGYHIVYDRDELAALSPDHERVLGLFASQSTFNDITEEDLEEQQLPMYEENAPTLAEMTDYAMRFFHKKGKQFFLVIEEEGTDNFGNHNNALGAITALSRSDDAMGVVMDYIDSNPGTTSLVVAADSDAGGMQVHKMREEKATEPLAERTGNGAPIDGLTGTNSLPFISKPDKFGNSMHFYISWAAYGDVYGGVVAKAHGLNANSLPNNVDNTDVYRFMYLNLFGEWLD